MTTLFDAPLEPPRRETSYWASEHARTVYETEWEDGILIRLRRIPKGAWVTSPTAVRVATEDVKACRWERVVPGVEDAA